MNYKTYLAAVAAMTFAAGTSSATTVFNDTFDTSLGTGTEEDVNFEVGSGRQSGGTTTSNYSEGAVSTAGALLNANQNLNGNDDVLLLRTQNASGAVQAFVDLDTNFGSSLAGQIYTITFDWFSARNDAGITDAWLAVSVGDDGSGVTGPNNPTADMGLLLRPAASGTGEPSAQVWRDNSAAGGGLGSFLDDSDVDTDGWGDRFNVVITIDETAGIGNATVGVVTTPYTSDAATTLDLARQTDLGSLSFDFENSTDRLLELRAHQGSPSVTNGRLHDARIDNLSITIIPEPTSLALLGLGGLLIARRRRG